MEWKSIDQAPHDQRVLVYADKDWYVAQYYDGEYFCYESGW